MVSAGLAEEDKAMMAAFDGVYLVLLDVDDWGWDHAMAGFVFDGIPVFFRIDENGNPTGDKIDGQAWGPDTLENIARVMGEWFHQP